MALGSHVDAGDVLVEFEARGQRLQLEAMQRRQSSLEAQLSALRDQLAVEEEVLALERSGAQTATAEARARRREGRAQAAQSADQHRRTEALAAHGAVSEAARITARELDAQRQAASDALASSIGRVIADRRAVLTSRRAAIQGLRREVARLEGEVRVAQASTRQLEHEIETRLVRAPISGVIAEMASLTPGAVVEEGENIAVLLPSGPLVAVADMDPSRAMGQVRVGQRGWLRLDGFPWAQYGAVAVVVREVAGELRDGRLRVEFELVTTPPQIALQHGLPGTVEIEIERVSPWTIMLRAAGQMLRAADVHTPSGPIRRPES